MPAEAPTAGLPPGHRIAEYEIVRVLGTGGFGITYLAFDHRLDGPVAIKEYFPADLATRGDGWRVSATATTKRDLFAWGLDRFLDEARTTHRFRHPNVVRAHRYLEANGTAYIVMEYVEGESLKAILDRRGRLSPEEWRPWMEALLEGLAHIHSHDYLHRDIKPANIVVRAEDGEPVLIDFGSARAQHRDRTHTQVLTAGYAPIEQYSTGAEQGPRADIYALAAVSYRVLAGTPLPSAPDRFLVDDHEPLTERLEGGERQWLAAIDHGLAVRPEDRPQAVDTWRVALQSPRAKGRRENRHELPAGGSRRRSPSGWSAKKEGELGESEKARDLTPADLGEAEWPWLQEDWVWASGDPNTEAVDRVILAPHHLSAHRCTDLLRAGSYLAVQVFETMEIHPVPVRWLGLHRLSKRTFDWLWTFGWLARLLALTLRFFEACANGRLHAERELRALVEPRYREEARRRQRAGHDGSVRREAADIDYEWVRERLEEKRRELFRRYSPDLTAGLKTSTGESAEDLVDRANHASSRELNFSLSDSDGILLNRIVEATARLDDGTFGICVHCSNELGRARLEAVPWAPYCIDCQELEETGRLPAAGFSGETGADRRGGRP